MGRRGDQLYVVAGAEHDESRSAAVPCLARSVEANRGANPIGDRRGDAGERGGVVGGEVRPVLAAGDVDRAPAPSSIDERCAQLERDPRWLEHVAVAGAALGTPLGRLAEDPDRNPARREARERVEVRDEVLAGDDARARIRGRLRCEHALADQLLRRVAGHQSRLWIERMPARRVAVDHPPQPRRDLAEVLLTRQRPAPE